MMSSETGKDHGIIAEFSREYDVTTIPKKGHHFKYQASEAERCALVTRYGILAIELLTAEGRMIAAGKGRFKLKTSFEAIITQTCVVSLEPVRSEITGEFEIILRHKNNKNLKEQSDQILLDPQGDDVEYISSRIIDIGEFIAQYLSLEINPYPRKPHLNEHQAGKNIFIDENHPADLKKKNPFEILKTLKD